MDRRTQARKSFCNNSKHSHIKTKESENEWSHKWTWPSFPCTNSKTNPLNYFKIMTCIFSTWFNSPPVWDFSFFFFFLIKLNWPNLAIGDVGFILVKLKWHMTNFKVFFFFFQINLEKKLCKFVVKVIIAQLNVEAQVSGPAIRAHLGCGTLYRGN